MGLSQPLFHTSNLVLPLTLHAVKASFRATPKDGVPELGLLPSLPASIPLRKVCPPDSLLRGVQRVFGMMPGRFGVGAGCTLRELMVQRVPTYRTV